MSWESSLEYYRIINEEIARRRGGLASARILMYSVDFAPLADCLMKRDWAAIAEELSGWARKLERAGADCLVIGTNTMHHVAPEISRGLGIPLLHIADSVGRELNALELHKVGLLGTKFTMELDFYREKLNEDYNVTVLIPDQQEREMINRVVFEELCLGRIEDQSRKAYLEIMHRLAAQGAKGMILGCTEIPLLVKPVHTSIPLLDTTRLHAMDAVRFALGD